MTTTRLHRNLDEVGAIALPGVFNDLIGVECDAVTGQRGWSGSRTARSP